MCAYYEKKKNNISTGEISKYAFVLGFFKINLHSFASVWNF